MKLLLKPVRLNNRIMKQFLTRYYHWLILGVALLAVLISVAMLTTWTMGLRESLSKLPGSAGKNGAAVQQRSTKASEALQLLKKDDHWKPRDDGASPLVSRQYLLKEGKLVDPLSEAAPLYPPVPNQWLIDHDLELDDATILDQDPKKKGFTIREEFLAGTDPNNPDQLPPLHTKLTYSEGDIRKSSYGFEFLGEEENEGRMEFELRPLQPLPNPAKGNRPDMALRRVPIGNIVPGAPFLKVTGFEKKSKTVNDTEYDVSELLLVNSLTGEKHILSTKRNHPRDYAPHPINMIESVNFHYQLTGAPEELIRVERGKGFTLHSLDTKHLETYKLVDFSSDGILLEGDGKMLVVKPSGASLSP